MTAGKKKQVNTTWQLKKDRLIVGMCNDMKLSGRDRAGHDILVSHLVFF